MMSRLLLGDVTLSLRFVWRMMLPSPFDRAVCCGCREILESWERSRGWSAAAGRCRVGKESRQVMNMWPALHTYFAEDSTRLFVEGLTTVSC